MPPLIPTRIRIHHAPALNINQSPHHNPDRPHHTSTKQAWVVCRPNTPSATQRRSPLPAASAHIPSQSRPRSDSHLHLATPMPMPTPRTTESVATVAILSRESADTASGHPESTMSSVAATENAALQNLIAATVARSLGLSKTGTPMLHLRKSAAGRRNTPAATTTAAVHRKPQMRHQRSCQHRTRLKKSLQDRHRRRVIYVDRRRISTTRLTTFRLAIIAGERARRENNQNPRGVGGRCSFSFSWSRSFRCAFIDRFVTRSAFGVVAGVSFEKKSLSNELLRMSLTYLVSHSSLASGI
ncbi:hypothetical protein EDC01DRAFT_676109 [Geopyxis carbonaria]|nr:hypothetical protein EDC01DRAFT_676109 [Geopyxis carbonaria]